MKNYIRLLYADTEVGVKLTLDANDGIKSMKDLKNQIREAKGDLVAMSEKFGESSEQARTAAKRVAELNDQLGDAKNLVDAFNPDRKFAALAQSLNGVLGGFTALQGAMGLLGIESEDVQKQLLKVQSAMALSQGLNQIGESINSFRTLGKTIIDTLGKNGLIGAAIAGVAALGAALAGVFSGPSLRMRELNNSMKELEKGTAEATKEVYEVRNAFDQARAGIISQKDALDKYNEGIGKTVGHARDLNEAEKLTAENAAAYIEVQGLKAQANYILQKSSELAAEAAIKESLLAKSGQGSFFKGIFGEKFEQQKKDADDLLKLIDGINAKIAAASANFKTVTGDSTPTGAGKSKAQQEREKEAFEYSTDLDNKLQKQIDFQNNSLALRRLFLAEQTKDDQQRLADEQAAFDEEYQEWLSLQERKKEAFVANAQATANALGALSDLFGKQTAAGKVLAIAQATINTYLGASKAIAMGGFAGIVQSIAVIAAGLAQVRNIIKVQVPGYSATGGNTPAPVSAPITPEIPRSTSTRLDADQINQIGNATVRAFVVESDVTNNQERIRRLNRAARL